MNKKPGRLHTFTEKELKVLSQFELDASCSAKEVAKLTKISVRTVESILQKYKESEFFIKQPITNLSSCGYSYFGIYFATGLRDSAQREAFIRVARKTPEVVWFAEIGGQFQFGLALCLKSSQSLQSFLISFCKQFPNLFRRKAFVIQTSAFLYPRKYQEKSYLSFLHIKNELGNHTLDNLDERILMALHSERWHSNRAMALKLNMPATTFEARMQKFTQRGIIAGTSKRLDPNQLGLITEKLLIYMPGMKIKTIQQMRDFCLNHRDVVALYECIGAWDFEINVEVLSPREVVMVINQLYSLFGNEIEHIEAISKFSDLKNSGVPFVQ